MINKILIALLVGLINLVNVYSQTNTIQNCSLMSSDNTYCQYCNSGYFLDNLQQTCTQQGPADLYCLQKYGTTCIKCECGYLIVSDKNTCAKATYQLRGCEVINPKQQCIRPKKDYVMSQSGNDVILRLSGGSNCELETKQFQCLQCHSGYKLDVNRNCIKVDQSIDNIFYSYFYGDQLKSRNSLYVPGDFGVYPIIQYCNQYIGSGDGLTAICSQCYDGMIPNLSQTACYVSPCNFCQYADLKDNVVICVQCERPNYFFVYTDTQNNQVCAPRSNFYFDNCKVRNPKSNTCSSCIPTFTYSYGFCQPNLWNQQNASNSIYGCSVYLNSNQCQQCSSGFLLEGGYCYETPVNCVDLNINLKCSQCSNLYYLDSQQKCQPISNPQNCVLSDGINNKCTQCQNLYYPDSNGTCQSIALDNCSLSDGINLACIKCYNLYYVNSNNNKCSAIADFSRCVVSDGISNICKYCKYKFLFDTVSQNCKAIITQQEPGFYKDSNGSIFNYDFTNWNYCIIFDDSSNKCIQCTNTYYVDIDGSCKSISSSCFTNGQTVDCVYCTGNQFINMNKQCVASTQCLGSFLTNGVTDECTSCSDANGNPGFTQYDNTQNPPQKICSTNNSSQNCVSYSNTQCQTCTNNYYLDSSYNCQKLSDQNCLQSDGKLNKCLVCQQGYYIQNQVCQPQNSMTITNSPSVNCLNQNQVFCTQCKNLFYLNTNTGQCFPISNPNCQKSNGFQDFCVDCVAKSNYINLNYPNYCGFPFCSTPNQQNPSSGCIKCEQNYYLTKQGSCNYITIKNCFSQNSDQECTLCDGNNNYYLAQMSYGGVICQKLNDPKCTKTDGKNQACVQCVLQYYPATQGYCLTIQDCQSIDATKGICIQCQDPSIPSLDSTQCVTLPNCQKTNGKICQQCNSSYYLQIQNGQSSCIKIRNCITSDGISLICSQCEVNFQFTNQCVPQYSQYPSQPQSQYILPKKYNDLQCQTTPSILCQQYQQVPPIKYNGQNPNFFISYQNLPNLSWQLLYCNKNDFLQQDQNGNYICSTISTLLTNCQLYNFDSSDCMLCPSLQYISTNGCLDFIDKSGCIYSYGVQQECLNCQKMKYFKNQSTTTGSSCQSVANSNVQIGCKLYNNQEQCVQCYENHYLSGTGTCSPRTIYDNCSTYDLNKDECLTCKPGFYLAINSNNIFSVSKNICQRVESTNVIINCIEYDSQQKCVKCNNTGLYGSLQEYYLFSDPNTSTNVCIDITDKQCQSYDGTNCLKKYIFGCQNYDSSFNTCILCQTGYYLDSTNNICKLYTAQNCAKYDPNNDKCISCVSSYFFDATQKCLLQISNCQTAENLLCILCNKDFTLSSQDNSCKQNVGANCTKGTYDSTSNKFTLCDLCNIGYALTSDQTQCIPYSLSIINCKLLKPLTKKYYECDKCLDDTLFFYSIGQNQCLPKVSQCSIPNCQDYDTQDSHLDYYYCSQCSNLYYVNQAARCSLEPSTPSPTSDNLPDPVISPNVSEIVLFFIHLILVFVF